MRSVYDLVSRHKLRRRIAIWLGVDDHPNLLLIEQPKRELREKLYSDWVELWAKSNRVGIMVDDRIRNTSEQIVILED